ncbi:MAG TPA: extracellular solute-binding protein, partial [Candidatus Agrococcus pullicola]|nr:extracellular solute-binding protein [Candidatus Agrococcus pullicola]
RRKTSVLIAGLSAVAIGVAGCTGGIGSGDGGGDSDGFTVVQWGGVSQEISYAEMFEPFAEEQGITISQDSPTDYAQLEAMVDAGQVSWDVVQGEPHFTARACADGKLEQLSEEVIEAAEENGVDMDQVTECSIPILYYTYNIAYNTDTFPDGHPTTWEEFFDTEEFPGKRGMWRSAAGAALETALLADGVAPEDLYPLDLDRAFEVLDSIREDIVWYDTGDEQIQLTASGETPLMQAWNGRMHAAAGEGMPVANEFSENLITYEHLMIPAGSENKELVEEWMIWYLNNMEAQASYAEASNYGVPSPNALELLDEETRDSLAGSDVVNDQAAAVMDYDYWAENFAEVTERFNVWLAD